MNSSNKNKLCKVDLITIIKLTTQAGKDVIEDSGNGTTYSGPPEKAAEFFLSFAYRRALFSAIQKANGGSYKGITLEIKHK